MHYLTKFMHAIGVFLIICFGAGSILLSYIERQLPAEIKKYVGYASIFENSFYDYRVKGLLKESGVNNDVILVAVDDESLQKINSWPVPRTVWAEFIDKMNVFGAKVVAFDVMFPEPVKACGAESPDDIFAASLKRFNEQEGRKTILAYTTSDYNSPDVFSETPEQMYNHLVDSQQTSEMGLAQKYIEKHTWPIQKFLDTGASLGYISMEEDIDGVFRHYQLVNNIDTLYFPSIGLLAYESYLGTGHKLSIDAHGNAEMAFGDRSMMINNRGETKIRWFGQMPNFGLVSLYEVISSKDDDKKLHDMFNGKIVFVGSTAAGAHDLRNTPVDAKTPGVYAHMNIIHMMMNQFLYQHPDKSMKYTFIFLSVGLLILLTVMHFGRAILDLFTLVLLSALALYLDRAIFLPDGYELRLFFTLFSYVSCYSWITFLNFNQASKEKKQIKGAFSRYVAAAVVDDMLKNPDKLKVGGEKRDITCLFSDVRDFTSISEKLTATELAWALNRYMGEMTDIVFATNGTLDKYIGDAIVAFWGAPLDIGDHVDQSVQAAVMMLEALPGINKEFAEKGLPEFKIGLGLNSGECSVGNMGSDQIFAYTALGDNMNLGARLESLCKHYGAQILISGNTYERIDHSKYVCRLIDRVRVKGKTEPVQVYEVLYSYHAFMIDQASLNAFKEAYELFLERKFEMALQLFDEILSKHPEDKASLRLKASCEHWIETPPTEDDDPGITTMTEK